MRGGQSLRRPPVLRQSLLSLRGIVAANESPAVPRSCRVEGAPAARLASG